MSTARACSISSSTSVITLIIAYIMFYSTTVLDIVTKLTIDKYSILWYTVITELEPVGILKKEVDND